MSRMTFCFTLSMREHMPSVTVIIPTIPPRAHLLHRAVDSVLAQTRPVDQIIIANDRFRQGAAANRQNALDSVTTKLVLCLDDDDVLKPDALISMIEHMNQTDSDMVYGHYEVIGGTDPRPENFGKPFDPVEPTQTTIVVLSKTEAAQDCGYVNPIEEGTMYDSKRMYSGEDHYFIKQAVKKGYKISHVPKIVFEWHHWYDPAIGQGNTSGLPSRW